MPNTTETKVDLICSAGSAENLLSLIMGYFYDNELPTLVPTENPKVFSVTKASGKELGSCWRVRQAGKRWRFEYLPANSEWKKKN